MGQINAFEHNDHGHIDDHDSDNASVDNTSKNND